jgi:methylphosphotriester-DNA--protein-cysteine methyltransferase
MGEPESWLGEVGRLFSDGRIAYVSDADLLVQLSRSERAAIKRLFGLRAKELLRRWRVGYGLRLMERSGLTVLEAALEAGFYDSAHFVHASCDVTGLPPRRFLNGIERDAQVA